MKTLAIRIDHLQEKLGSGKRECFEGATRRLTGKKQRARAISDPALLFDN